MPSFIARAYRATDNKPLKVEVYLGGRSRGYTSLDRNRPLIFQLASSGRYSWYAKKDGRKIQEGTSSGGDITILV